MIGVRGDRSMFFAEELTWNLRDKHMVSVLVPVRSSPRARARLQTRTLIQFFIGAAASLFAIEATTLQQVVVVVVVSKSKTACHCVRPSLCQTLSDRF